MHAQSEPDSDPQPTGPVELTSQLPVTDAPLARVRAKLATTAQLQGLVDLGYRVVDSPVGPLLLVASDHGLLRVAFATEGFEAVLQKLAVTRSPRILEAPDRLDVAASQLSQYFAGERQEFDLALDFALSSGFRLTVQRYLPTIGYGHTESYKQLAARVGNPHAVRAVGTACATNPLPIVVPCHRVLRSDGSLGGYLGGLDAKRTLLQLEATSASGISGRG